MLSQHKFVFAGVGSGKQILQDGLMMVQFIVHYECTYRNAN